MIALRLFPFLKAVALKFAYYVLGGIPIIFLILGKDHLYYSIFAAIFAFIAVHFLKREIKKVQPMHERNLTEYIAIALSILLFASLVFSHFYGLAV
ncbi:hypothetical protein [Adhaeribacter terreus]|uniref:Uncharacterized protein n=1 Tax=Adhaeribacter terreus TaxID=529703 RepID=A0ABW0E7E9_9BACT